MASRQSPRRLRIALCPSKTKPNYTSSMRIDPRSHVSERKRTRPEHTQCKCVQISLLTADRLFFFRFKPHFISNHNYSKLPMLFRLYLDWQNNRKFIPSTAQTFSDFSQTRCPHSSLVAYLSSIPDELSAFFVNSISFLSTSYFSCIVLFIFSLKLTIPCIFYLCWMFDKGR